MRYVVTMIINDGRPSEVDIHATCTERAVIHITAKTLQEGADILKDAEEKAKNAARDWKPVEKKEAPKPTKTREEFIEEYEATTDGKRFLKQIENSRTLEEKYGFGGLRMSQVDYLATKHRNNLINGVTDLYALGYKSGFDKAKKLYKVKK